MTRSLLCTSTIPIMRTTTPFLNYPHIAYSKSNASLRITRLWKIKPLSLKIFLIGPRHWRVLRKRSNATGSIDMHSLTQTGKKEHKCGSYLCIASAPDVGEILLRRESIVHCGAPGQTTSCQKVSKSHPWYGQPA